MGGQRADGGAAEAHWERKESVRSAEAGGLLCCAPLFGYRQRARATAACGNQRRLRPALLPCSFGECAEQRFVAAVASLPSSIPLARVFIAVPTRFPSLLFASRACALRKSRACDAAGKESGGRCRHSARFVTLPLRYAPLLSFSCSLHVRLPPVTWLMPACVPLLPLPR